MQAVADDLIERPTNGQTVYGLAFFGYRANRGPGRYQVPFMSFRFARILNPRRIRDSAPQESSASPTSGS